VSQAKQERLIINPPRTWGGFSSWRFFLKGHPMQTDDSDDFNAGDRAVGLVTKGILLFMFFHVLAEFIDLYF
jgi:hypothetical protein